MSEVRERRFRWPVVAGLGAAVAALVLVLVTVVSGDPEPVAAGSTPPPAPVTTQASSPPPPTETGTPASLAASEPVWLEIPAIDVRTDEIIDLGLQPNGELEVPDDAVTAGWYTKSPTPGEVGPSVIAGHVDYDGVAGVFFRLHELSPGDTATVHRDDGSAVEFTITRVEQYGKDAFPTEQVYGNTDGPELRLITCGGDFDRDSGEYLDNVVAYATMTGVRQG